MLILSCAPDRYPVDPKAVVPQDLSGRDFRFDNLSEYNLSDKTFDRADLTYGMFRGKGTMAQRASFRQAIMTGFTAGGADFTEADFTEAELTESALTDTNFTDARFTNAILVMAALMGSNFTRTDFTGADLTDADLRFATLDEANFHNATVTEAQLAAAASRRCMILPDGTVYTNEGPCP